MPIYKYQYRQCGAMFERMRGVNDDDGQVACPKCGHTGPQRVFAAFSTRSVHAPSGPT